MSQVFTQMLTPQHIGPKKRTLPSGLFKMVFAFSYDISAIFTDLSGNRSSLFEGHIKYN